MRSLVAAVALALLAPTLGQDISGLWKVEGTAGNRTYSGWATLSKKGERWEVSSRARGTGIESDWSGEGTLEGTKLTIARGAGGGAAGALNGVAPEAQTVVFDVAADGKSLSGSVPVAGATASERWSRGSQPRGSFQPKELVLRRGETVEVQVEVTPADALPVLFVGGARPTHATATRSGARVVVTGREPGTTSVLLRVGTKGPILASLPVRVEASICAQVLERVKQLAAAGKKPVVIFDLDDTLFDTRPRTLVALKDFPNEPRLQQGLTLEMIKHGLPETLMNAGFSAAEVEGQAGKKIRSHWSARFFKNESLRNDRPLEGAVEYVKALSAAGAHICYVTGRKETMHALSKEVLETNGFPVDEARATLFLKDPAGGEKTHDFKGRVTRETIANMGTIVAAFDNEPANSNAFRENLPKEARSVFVDTLYPDDSPALIGGIDTIPDFLE